MITPKCIKRQKRSNTSANSTEQSKIVAEYFKKTFCKNKQPIRPIPQTQMTPFTVDKIPKIIAKMQPKKSLGCDEIPFELTKYAPETINEQIAEINNTMVETGDTPKEITYGILKPVQKSNKAKDPASNLRLIILLSSFRKIFAACIISRIKDRLDAEIHHHKQPAH